MMTSNTALEFGSIKVETQNQPVHVKAWDQHRKNPTAEVVLVSRDEIGFRVEAWYIMKHSPIVKRLVESARSADTPVPFIQLKQNGNVVRHFIDGVTSAHPPKIDLPYRGARDMWDLCKTLGATVVQSNNKEEEEPDTEDDWPLLGENDPIAIDIHYCNPDAKVVLISNDKVALGVDAWYMSRQSDYIKGLMRVPSEQNIESAPIHLDHDHEIIRRFIDLLYLSTSSEIDIDLSRCEELLVLSDLFGSPRGERYILYCLRKAMNPDGGPPAFDAWKAFRIAAQRDYVGLAKAAISCHELSGYSIKERLTNQSTWHFDDIPPRYIYALMRSAWDSSPRVKYDSYGRPIKDAADKETIYLRNLKAVSQSFCLE